MTVENYEEDELTGSDGEPDSHEEYEWSGGEDRPDFYDEMAAGVVLENIREAAPDLFKLAQNIVESGRDYDLVLSDDASARLVSIFVHKVLSAVREKNGLPKPDIKFVAGGSHDNEEIYEAITQLIKRGDYDHVLLVTEFIESGSSIKKLVKILEELHLRFDVAALSGAEYGTDYVKESFVSPDSRLYLGDYGRSGLSFYNKNFSGVEKNKSGGSPFPKKRLHDHLEIDYKLEEQSDINQARKDINLLAQETLKELGIIK